MEGNEFPDVYLDGIFGSSGHITLYRNRLKGYDDDLMHNEDICTVCIQNMQEYVSVIGNVLGWPASGYQTSYSDPSSPDSIYLLNAYTVPTLLRGGNFDTVTGTVVWKDTLATLTAQGKLSSADAGGTYLSTQSLPPSLYRTSKPTWFGVTPWPALGPDVAGGDASVAGHAYDIPAKRCFLSQGLASNPAAFNPGACYGN
jgi:hypothetical protein